MNWIAVGAAGLFVLVGGFMNFTFASTLGSDELTTRCWQALSVGATLYTVVGVSLSVEQWRAGDRPRAISAGLVLVLALAYDWSAAYGFSARQHATTEISAAEKERAHKDAKDALQLAQANFEPYRAAPDVAVAQAAEMTAKAALEAIDAAPGVMDRLGPCRDPRSAGARDLCGRRPAAFEAAQRASTELARAQAKARLWSEVEAAQRKLSSNPPAPPADPRAALLGTRLMELLPVALLMGGSLFGFFAAARPTQKPHAPTGNSPVSQLATSNPSPDPPSAVPGHPSAAVPGQSSAAVPAGHPSAAVPGQSPSAARVKPGADKLAKALRAIEADATSYGLTVDSEKWIRGTQRAIASAAGIRSTSTLNRSLHDAAAAGLVEIDTSGKDTAIRVIK